MLKYWIVCLRSYCDKICTRPAVVMVGKADRFSFVTKCESRIVLFRQFCRSPLLSELNARPRATPKAPSPKPHPEPQREVDRKGQPYYIRPHHHARRTMRGIASCIVSRRTTARLTVHTSPTSTTARVPCPTPSAHIAHIHNRARPMPHPKVDRKGQPWGGAANLGVL